ncbi:MAG TPA: ice-binding family protein, partial [Verrucomicrobiae bacterium]
GIWESGGGMAADGDGNLYVVTGNGTVGDAGDPTSLTNRAESALKLTRSGSTLHVASYFTPYASTLTTTSGRQVILSGGAQAANIFWQVGSSATLGTTSVFKGSILALTSIALQTGATVEGLALARNGAVTLDSNTITIPGTVTAPVILVSAALATGPYTDAAGQSLNLTTKTLTVPLSGSMQFYRIRSTTGLTIRSITISGADVVITYD